jgi:glycine oxidase
VRASVIGAGVAGLTCAIELAERGVSVAVYERGATLGTAACSWQAGGMLAPWCECESAEPLVAQLGQEATEWWSARVPGVVRKGTLVVAHSRDAGELTRFARRTEQHTEVDGAQIAQLEPDLAGRFQSGLFFPSEAHLDPRVALNALVTRLRQLGAVVYFGTEVTPAVLGDSGYGAEHVVIDCRGLAAREALRDLRGVKGEMVLLRQRELSLSRPVRILHPRIPLYVVPRGEGVFMVGATMTESDESRQVTARSVLELLSAAYALHPAFGEAEIVEIGTGVRPAFADNLPRIRERGGVLFINGFYRHGFLLAPALARIATERVLEGRWHPRVMGAPEEVTDEDHREW